MASLLRVAASATLLLAGSTAPVPSKTLSNGVQMPMVAVGTWLYNDTEAATTVEAALSVGVTHIDTAYNYGNQRGVGQGLLAAGKKREDLFVTTKVPGCGLQNISRHNCFGDTLKLIEQNIQQMSEAGYPLNYLDLILIHNPPCVDKDYDPKGGPGNTTCLKEHTGCSAPDNCKAVGEQWRALAVAYEAKWVRAVGVSNYCSACFACLGDSATVKPMVNQVQFHVGMGPDPQGFLSLAKREGIVMEAWSPLGSGGHGNPEILSGKLTTGIAKAHNVSTAQVALKWIVSHGVVVATKSSNVAHLAEDIDLFDWELTEEEMTALDAADFAKNDPPSFMCNDVQPPALDISV